MGPDFYKSFQISTLDRKPLNSQKLIVIFR